MRTRKKRSHYSTEVSMKQFRRAFLLSMVCLLAQRGFAAGEDVDCLARLEADGCAIVPGDAIDRPAFAAAVAEIRGAEIARLDPALMRAL